MPPRLLLVAAFAGTFACTTLPDTQPLPAFPAYLPERAGENRIYLLARGHGRLARRGRCLGVTSEGGHFTAVIWPHTARLARDREGLFVSDSESGARIRLGQRFEWGGGSTPREVVLQLELTEPVPPECLVGALTTLNPGFSAELRTPTTSTSR